MADESLNDMLVRFERLGEACDKLDAAHMLVKDVSLENRLNLPELLYPFGFVAKLARCRAAAHKERKAYKKKVRAAMEAYEAQQRAEREEREREAKARWEREQLEKEWDEVQAIIKGGISRRAVIRKKLYGIDVNTDMQLHGTEVSSD